jgi:ribosomal protein L7/L12
MKIILTLEEAMQRLRHSLQVDKEVQVIISRSRVKAPPKPKTESVTDTRTPHRRVFEEIEALDHAGNDKIQCIRILRENFQLGLAEAKWIVEQWVSEDCRVIFKHGDKNVLIKNNNTGSYQKIDLYPR